MAASWPESKALSEQNLSDLVDQIDQAEQNIIDGKGTIATAITAMGQSAAPSDTHAQLASKIRDISKDANAVASDVSAGQTFYQGGQKRTGTMPYRGAPNQTITTQGGEISLAAGEYAGGKIKAQFANLIPANIRRGIRAGGVDGNLIVRKEANGNGILNVLSGNRLSLIVSGLDFNVTRLHVQGSFSAWYGSVGYTGYSFACVEGELQPKLIAIAGLGTVKITNVWVHKQLNGFEFEITADASVAQGTCKWYASGEEVL